MMTISLRQATPADETLLREWDEQPHVVAANPNDDWNWDVELARQPAWRELLIIHLDERPIGFLQIIDPALEETHYWGNVEDGLRALDIWIGEPDCIGKGYGFSAMSLAMDRCFRDSSVNALLVDPLVSNEASHRFYERCGFVRIDRRFFDDDDCLVFRLDREAWERSRAFNRGSLPQ